MEKIKVSITLPRDLWEQFLGQARTEQQDETTLLTRAIEQFLQKEAVNLVLTEQLRRECEELAQLDFDDVGTEDEWLILQNEALNNSEVDLA